MGPALYNPLQMSQITRCPACSTQFKVVADQLRISDGWVRCGHCAEVFDASESLMPAPPPALLPDVSLTDVRPPPMPVARADDSSRAWGAPPAPVQKAFSRVVVEPDAPSGNAPAPSGAGVLAEAPFARPAEVLSVPDPVPPAFLAAEPPLVGAEPPPIFEPAATFAWKGADAPSVPPKAPVAPPLHHLRPSLQGGRKAGCCRLTCWSWCCRNLFVRRIPRRFLRKPWYRRPQHRCRSPEGTSCPTPKTLQTLR